MTALTKNGTNTLPHTFADPNEFMKRALNEFTRPLRLESKANYDLIRNEDSYEFHVNVPGFDRDDVSVEFDGKALTVSASSEENSSDDKIVSQRRRSFSYSWPVADDMEAEEAKATLENGVLEIHVPRKEQYVGEDDTKTIEIE